MWKKSPKKLEVECILCCHQRRTQPPVTCTKFLWTSECVFFAICRRTRLADSNTWGQSSAYWNFEKSFNVCWTYDILAEHGICGTDCTTSCQYLTYDRIQYNGTRNADRWYSTIANEAVVDNGLCPHLVLPCEESQFEYTHGVIRSVQSPVVTLSPYVLLLRSRLHGPLWGGGKCDVILDIIYKTREWLSHGHWQYTWKIWWSLDLWLPRCSQRQTERPMVTHACSSEWSTPIQGAE